VRLSRRVKVAGGVVLAALVLAGSWIGYRILTHGPPALIYARVGPPAARLRYGPGTAQTIDLRVPTGAGPFPVVVLIHGGCWTTEYGSPAYMAPLADALLRHGVASANIGYRRVGEAGGGWPGTFRDVGAAVDAIRMVGPRYRLDPTRVVVAGHSAGAPLALWSATRARLPATSDVYADRPLIPRAVVAIDGPGALGRFIGQDADICGDPAIVPLMGGTPTQFPRRYADVTPQDRLPLGVPQFLIQGGMDHPDDAYVVAARASGDPVRFVRPPGRVTHFDVLMPWQQQGKPTLDALLSAAAVTVGARTPSAIPAR
jgi:acetyl esterase/lipase